MLMTMQISATRLPTPILISHSPKQCLVLFELRRAGIDHEPNSAGIRVPFQLPVNGPGAFPFEGSSPKRKAQPQKWHFTSKYDLWAVNFFRRQPERRVEERRVPVALLRPPLVVDRRDLEAAARGDLAEPLVLRAGFLAIVFVLLREVADRLFEVRFAAPAAAEAGFFLGLGRFLITFRAALANDDTASPTALSALPATSFAPSNPAFARPRPALAVSTTVFWAVVKMPSCSLSTGSSSSSVVLPAFNSH